MLSPVPGCSLALLGNCVCRWQWCWWRVGSCPSSEVLLFLESRATASLGQWLLFCLNLWKGKSKLGRQKRTGFWSKAEERDKLRAELPGFHPARCGSRDSQCSLAKAASRGLWLRSEGSRQTPPLKQTDWLAMVGSLDLHSLTERVTSPWPWHLIERLVTLGSHTLRRWSQKRSFWNTRNTHQP